MTNDNAYGVGSSILAEEKKVVKATLVLALCPR